MKRLVRSFWFRISALIVVIIALCVVAIIYEARVPNFVIYRTVTVNGQVSREIDPYVEIPLGRGDSYTFGDWMVERTR
jgi:hypothetical protein